MRNIHHRRNCISHSNIQCIIMSETPLHRPPFDEADLLWLDQQIIKDWEEAGTRSTFTRIAYEQEIEQRCIRLGRMELLEKLKRNIH